MNPRDHSSVIEEAVHLTAQIIEAQVRALDLAFRAFPVHEELEYDRTDLINELTGLLSAVSLVFVDEVDPAPSSLPAQAFVAALQRADALRQQLSDCPCCGQIDQDAHPVDESQTGGIGS